MATIATIGIAAAGVGLSAYSAFNQPDAPSGGGGAYGPQDDPYAEMQAEYLAQAAETMGAAADYDKQMEQRRRQMQNLLGTDAQKYGVVDYKVDQADAALRKSGKFGETDSFRRGLDARQAWRDLSKTERKALKESGIGRKDLKHLQKELADAKAMAEAGDVEGALKKKRQAEAGLALIGIDPAKVASTELTHKWKPEERAAFKDLQSPTGMMVGDRMREARELQDPTSERSKNFYRMLTHDPIMELSQAEDEAHDVLAMSERESARTSRDFAGAAGNMRSFGAEQAMRERSAEKFGTAHALMRQQTGVAKAKVFGEASRFYNEYRTAYADSALGAAESWVNNQSFVRDSFRQLQMTAATALMGVSTMGAQLAGQMGATAMAISSNERMANQEMQWAAAQQKAQAIASLGGALMGMGSTFGGYAMQGGGGGGGGGGGTAGGYSGPGAGGYGITMNA
jgi:hypothetical protein